MKKLLCAFDTDAVWSATFWLARPVFVVENKELDAND